MKKKRILISIVTFTLILLILGACGNKSVDKELIGMWDVTADNGSAGTMNIKDNNTLITKFAIFEDAYNYEIDTDNNELSVWREKSKNDIDVYKIKKNNDGFTLMQTNKENEKDNEILTLTRTDK